MKFAYRPDDIASILKPFDAVDVIALIVSPDPVEEYAATAFEAFHTVRPR